MKLVRKAWPYILSGVALCLNGLLFWYVSRKLSSSSLNTSSEAVEEAQKDLEAFKRRTELELATAFDRVKSVLGRLDRQKRTEKTSEEPLPGSPTDGVVSGDDEQSRLNRALAHRVHGGIL